eukprot:CAMPEP_0198510708 /NCGR_PEP_ID=MMETSP1462-20131121/14357_1 /TAXON_ID=1333877 /ORGANISM="Brandtodinium nutriculum, Strain RCC3387" /LENGTH=82 /DNA_ID=CAMNT_0044240047 /DNA_START=41 /DNA_END=289 /DNA_ORIENTATION=-
MKVDCAKALSPSQGSNPLLATGEGMHALQALEGAHHPLQTAWTTFVTMRLRATPTKTYRKRPNVMTMHLVGAEQTSTDLQRV